LVWLIVGRMLLLVGALRGRFEDPPIKPLDGLERFRLARARLRRRLPDDDLVDEIVMFAASPRYRIVDRLFLDTGLRRRSWAVYAWPDDRGTARLIALATRSRGSDRSGIHSPWAFSPANSPERTPLVLPPISHMGHHTAYAALGPCGAGDRQRASAVVLFCRDGMPEDIFRTWPSLGCSEGLGTRSNASAADLWSAGPCAELGRRCGAVWSWSRSAASPPLPCWDEALLAISGRLSPDRRSLVIRSSLASLDYVWRFEEGREPMALQEHQGACPRARSTFEGFLTAQRDRRGGFSPDDAFYVTNNASHILTYDTSTLALALSIPADAGFPQELPQIVAGPMPILVNSLFKTPGDLQMRRWIEED